MIAFKSALNAALCNDDVDLTAFDETEADILVRVIAVVQGLAATTLDLKYAIYREEYEGDCDNAMEFEMMLEQIAKTNPLVVMDRGSA